MKPASNLRLIGTAFTIVITLGTMPAQQSFAETWTDISGSFSIEAEYAGVSGTNVVLRKADGKTVNVPIARLSEASRAQAKKLYELAKNSKPAGAAVAPTLAKYLPQSRQLSFTPPTLPSILPLAAFPENATLQQSWEHVRTQALAGHLEVLWFALSDDIRAFADSTEVREKLRPFANDNFKFSPEMIGVTNKVTELLVTKKAFILNSPLLAQVPADYLPMIRQAYDPAVGVIHEYADFAFNSEAVLNHSLTDYMTYHLPRIGAQIQALLKVVPPQMIDSYLNQVTTEQTGESTGKITFPKQQGGTEVVEMVRHMDRWLPQDMVHEWVRNKDTILEKMVANASSGMQVGNSPETKAMISGVIQQIELALKPMLAATTQQEFDFAVGQSLTPLMMLMGGQGGPGGAGGGFSVAPNIIGD